MCEGQVKPITLCNQQQSVISLKHSFRLLCMGQLDWPRMSLLRGSVMV